MRPWMISAALLLALPAACKGEQVGGTTVEDGSPLDDSALDGSAVGDSALDDSALGDSADAASFDAGSDASAPIEAGTCGALHGGPMVLAGTFCIDETEVTRGEYRLFLLAADRAAKAPASCSWNTSFGDLEPDPSKWQLPISDVDWCDAATYCAWAGKRLCGKIQGANVPFFSHADASQSEWFQACSANGARTYPYEGSYDEDRCATYALLPGFVKSRPGCTSAAGAFDLSGNVWEWENSCSVYPPGATSECRIRGGAVDTRSGSTCAADRSAQAESRIPGIGVRCCKDP